MTNIAPLERSDLPEFEPGFQIVEAVMGFVPRSMFTMGRNPELLRSFNALTFDERFTDAERAALRLARDAATVPNATTPEHFAALAAQFTDDQVIELVAVISLFGWLNRWNDTMATDLEDEALEFGRQHLAAQGSTPG